MLKAEKQKRRFTKQEWSWIMYDWANSVYATNIMAAIFPTIFVSVAGAAGDQWWGYATSVATFLVAVLAPLLGAVADYQGMKKKFFSVFAGIGIVFTALIAATNDWRVMLVGYVISRIGFSGSNLFYDSFRRDHQRTNGSRFVVGLCDGLYRRKHHSVRYLHRNADDARL